MKKRKKVSELETMKGIKIKYKWFSDHLPVGTNFFLSRDRSRWIDKKEILVSKKKNDEGLFEKEEKKGESEEKEENDKQEGLVKFSVISCNVLNKTFVKYIHSGAQFLNNSIITKEDVTPLGKDRKLRFLKDVRQKRVYNWIMHTLVRLKVTLIGLQEVSRTMVEQLKVGIRELKLGKRYKLIVANLNLINSEVIIFDKKRIKVKNVRRLKYIDYLHNTIFQLDCFLLDENEGKKILRFDFITTHLKYGYSRILDEHLAKVSNGKKTKAIICGDFNVSSRKFSKYFKKSCDNFFLTNDSFTHLTADKEKPMRNMITKFDYLICTKNFGSLKGFKTEPISSEDLQSSETLNLLNKTFKSMPSGKK